MSNEKPDDPAESAPRSTEATGSEHTDVHRGTPGRHGGERQDSRDAPDGASRSQPGAHGVVQKDANRSSPDGSSREKDAAAEDFDDHYPPTEAMLAEPVDPDFLQASTRRLRKAWETPKGWRYWSAVNNTEIGVWYCLTAFFFMLCAGVLALAIRIQLAFPGNDFLDADRFNQFFTMHGSAMMFLFAVPLFEAISILLLPGLLGARDMPFPRLSAFGFWCFVIGGVFVLGSILFDAAPSSGWFMYPPLAIEDEGVGSDIWLLGLSFIEIASIAAAVELIVGVLKCRPPGMRINLMPLYAWYVLVVGGMILFAFPPLIAGDLLFEMQRSFDWPFFDPERGGDPMLWQHLFWIFGHPEVYIIFLPSIAIAAMVIPTIARTAIVGYSWIVLSAVGTGFLSFGLWVHHMFTTGLPAMSLGFFSAASEAVVIPTGIQLFAFVATLMVGRVTLNVPMLFIAGALAIFTAGGLTGVMLALAPFNWQVHDTYFVVAHLHYTLFGGMIFPVLAGIYYFFPVFTKKSLSPRLGRWAFWLLFSGFNITFLPMHLTGLLGMPRRVYTYPTGLGWDWLNLLSTVGAFILAAGFLVFAWDLLRPKGRQPLTERNPWQAGTLEWTHDVPEEAWGIRSIPYVTSRYPLWDQEKLLERIDGGRYYLADSAEGKRETLITSVLDARPLQCMRVTGPTWITLVAAGFTGGAFIFPTFHLYAPAVVCAVLAGIAILYWLWTSTAPIPEQESKPVGLGLKLPIYASGPASAGWWGVWITMLGDATAFISLVFGFFFYWTARPDFPPAGSEHAHLAGMLVGGTALLGAWALTLRAQHRNRASRQQEARLSLSSGIGLSLVGMGLIAWSVLSTDMNPTEHVYPAVIHVLLIWLGVHVFVGVVMQAYSLVGSFTGKLTPTHDADLQNALLFWHFLGFTTVVSVLVMAIFPRWL